MYVFFLLKNKFENAEELQHLDKTDKPSKLLHMIRSSRPSLSTVCILQVIKIAAGEGLGMRHDFAP